MDDALASVQSTVTAPLSVKSSPLAVKHDESDTLRTAPSSQTSEAATAPSRTSVPKERTTSVAAASGKSVPPSVVVSHV